jgi:HD-GYP domain-containing protein (c-di-GMP phosphodiesterase class II)
VLEKILTFIGLSLGAGTSTLQRETGRNPSIQRQLLYRLVIAASVISVALAVTVFLLEFNRLGSLVNGRAGEIVASFNTQIRHLLDTPGESSQAGLPQELKMLLIAGKSNQWMGQLVYSGIYDLHGEKIAAEIDGKYSQMADLEKLLQSLRDRSPGKSKRVNIFKRIKGTPYVELTFPLTNSAGEQVAILEGIFAVSLQVRDEVVGRIMRSVFGAIGIVLLTTLILYPVIITLIRQLSKLTENLLEANVETLRVVGSAIAKRDSDTDSHNYRVTIYSVTLAETLGLKPKMIQGLIKGAFLHDVGKIGISDQILLKPGKLSEPEIEAMKRHVSHGLDIVKRSEWLKDATDVVAFHHEKFSGTGYPHGFTGSEIPVNARIFAIADVFDALTSARPYKKPMSFEQAMEILNRGRGSHFDPSHLDSFNIVAQSLYDSFAHCSDKTLHTKMESIISTYFSRG